MSGAVARLQRILRVRGLEHRIAQMRLAEADRRLSSLAQIGERIDLLRMRAAAGSGLTDGGSLNAAGEMAGRLESAKADMTAPVAAARAERSEREIRRTAAWASEEGTSRLHLRAAQSEAASAETRADANRPYRGKPASILNRKAAS